ncbi:MAG: carboxypeptidase regulatory-like domain-containing protein [Acidobacteria bacterium]|nr:carboxypeptidase regulatory-like domain-containing protein [Acidobacteriota bacterium]
MPPMPLAASLVALALVAAALVPAELAAQPAGQRMPPRMIRPGEEAPKGTAVLRGVVVAADTGAPIRRAQVRASAPGVQDTRTTLSDEQGRFEIKELAGGRYTIVATKGGFVSLQYGQRRPSEPGTPVDLAAGQTLEKIVVGLPRGSVITGRIADEFGEPLTGAQVRVLRYGYAAGARRLLPAGQSDRTDDQGTFRVFGLSPGDYVVSATLNEDRALFRQRSGGDDEAATTGYAPTYFPGTTNAADAQRVTVGLGQEVSGIGFGLSLMPLAKVSGRVVGMSGLELAGLVMALPDDTVRQAMSQPRGAAVNADGTFELRGLAPGRYTLVVGGRGRQGGDEPTGRTPITVSGVDLTGVAIALAPPASVVGVVQTDTGAVGLRSSQVRISFTPAQPAGTTGLRSRGGAVNGDFTFELTGVSEPGYLRVTAPPGWQLKAIMRDGRDVTDELLALEPGTQLSAVRVVLTQTVTTFTGSVRDERGNAVLDTTVVVFPDDERQWTYQSRFIRTARPDTSGRFEIVGLPHHDGYRVVAIQGLEDGQATDPEFLAQLRDSGERLTLAEGETKSLDLRLRQ